MPAAVPPSRLPALVLLAFALPALAACAPQGEPGARRFLTLGSAPPGGAFFVVGGALAEVLNELRAETGWRMTNEATQGTQENIRRLDRGELDFALGNSAITYFAVRGEEGWERPHEVRAVMTLAPNVGLFLALRGSGVDSLDDLAGRRVLTGPEGAGFEYFLRPILAAHGVAWDGFSPLHASQSAAVELLGDGTVAAAFLGGAVPTPSIVQAATSHDVVFLPYDEAATAALAARYPFFAPATIPEGTYRGQREPFHGLDVGSMHLITAAGQDEELVYRVARALWERREAVAERHAAGRAIRPEVVARDTGTPFHPGAIRFYRELGVWSEPEPERTPEIGSEGHSEEGPPGGDSAD